MKNLSYFICSIILVFLHPIINAQNTSLVMQIGHTKPVSEVQFSVNGKNLVSYAKAASEIKIWDVNTGKLLRTIQDTIGDESISISSNCRYLAYRMDYYTAIVYNVATGERQKITIERDKKSKFSRNTVPVEEVLVHPVSGDLYVFSDSIYILSGEKWGKKRSSPFNIEADFNFIDNIAFASKGDLLRVYYKKNRWSGNGEVFFPTLISTDDYSIKKQMNGSLNYTTAQEVDGDAGLFATANDKIVLLYDIQKEREIRAFFKHNKQITDIAFAPGGEVMASSAKDNTVRIWNVKNGIEIKKLMGHDNEVTCINYNKSGNLLASADITGNIIIWKVPEYEPVKNLTSISQAIDHLVTDPTGDYLCAATEHGFISAWNIEEGKLERVADRKQKIEDFLFSSNYQNLQISYNPTDFDKSDKHLIMENINLDNGYETRQYAENMLPSKWGSYYLSPSGETYCRQTRLWLGFWEVFKRYKYVDVTNGEKLKSFLVLGDWFLFSDWSNTSFSEKGDFAFIRKFKKTKILDLSNGSIENVLKYPQRSRYNSKYKISPDGKYLFTFEQKKHDQLKFNVYRIGKNRPSEKHEIKEMPFPENIKVSFDNRYMAFSSKSNYLPHDDNLYVLDIEKAEIIDTISCFSPGSKAFAFNPKSNKLIIGDMNGSLIVYDIEQETQQLTLVNVHQSDEYIVVDNQGRFDGTEVAIDQALHFVKGMEVIPLESLFEKYYTPNLYKRVINGEKLPDISTSDGSMDKIQLPPGINIHLANKQKSFNTRGAGLLYTPQKDHEIDIKVTDQGGGIDEVQVFQNGKIIYTTGKGFKPQALAGEIKNITVKVKAVPGENELTVKAINNQRTESVPQKMSFFMDSKQGLNQMPDLYVLAIGIDNYKNPAMNLKVARNDASKFIQSLNEGGKNIFNEIHVWEIFNDEANKANIQSAFSEIADEATQDDLFIFYYAGHGAVSPDLDNEFFLIPHDVTQIYGADEMLIEKAIPSSLLFSESYKIKALKQIIFLDACQSGGALQTYVSRGAAEQKAIMQLARSAGVTILAAAGADQYASEFQELGHGVFTYALLEGLAGSADGGSKDCKITISELKAYITDRIPDLSEKYRGQPQYPTGMSRGQDFPVAVSNCK